MMMKPHCMVVVQSVLPAVRLLVMKNLIEKHHLRKIDVSQKMELTPAAISQYLKGKRGGALVDDISNSESIMRIVSEIAENLAKDEPMDDIIERLCDICELIRSEGKCMYVCMHELR